MRGGYKLIDFGNNSLSSTATKISGIYDAIEGNYRKPLVLSNLVFEGVEYADVFSNPLSIGNTFTFTCYGKTITISQDDNVIIA